MTTTSFERPAPAQDPQETAERVRAARALLATPLITSRGSQSEELRLVRRHQGELTRMFADGLGYRLHVDPAAARLFKTGLGHDATRPLRRRSRAPFTPRAYALLCLTLAALTRSKGQLLVDELVMQVRSAAVDAGVEVDLDSTSDRRALHAALVVLVRLGVLHERDGDLEHWADQRTQSLLDVHRDVLTLIVAAPLSSARSAEDLLDQVALPSAAGGARIAIRRRLLESPVLTVADLTDDQAEWWGRNRNRERDWFRDRFGLELELRAEGAIAIDPDDELTDEPFPGNGGTRQLALLVLEALADRARAGGGDEREGEARARVWRGIPESEALDVARRVLAQWVDGLRRDQRENPEGAVREALDLLRAMGVVRCDTATGLLLVHAAATRYAARAVLADASTSGERSLFDVSDEDG